MKRIIFVRHAKAETHNAELPDFERSLTSKGKDVSRLMSKNLKSKIKDIGVIITSPAFRAIETALIFGGEFGIKAENIIIKSNLYSSFNEKSFMDLLRSVPEETETITLFGHNPSFTELAGYYSKEGGVVIPKCGIVSITFDVKIWSDIGPNSGSTELFLKPRNVL